VPDNVQQYVKEGRLKLNAFIGKASQNAYFYEVRIDRVT
jgi:hypothetical protein